jgi:hypothetical protein
MKKLDDIDEIFKKCIPIIKKAMIEDGDGEIEIELVLNNLSEFLLHKQIDTNTAFWIWDALGKHEKRDSDLERLYKDLRKFALPKK